MTTYEIIDTVCDSVNPILVVISLVLIIRLFFQKRFKFGGIGIGFFLLSAVLVYGLMFLDNSQGFWEMMGGDYSTHTALCVAMCLTIYTTTKHWIAPLVVFTAYVILMLIQKYHSVFDIFSTGVVIALPLLALAVMVHRQSSLHNK